MPIDVACIQRSKLYFFVCGLVSLSNRKCIVRLTYFFFRFDLSIVNVKGIPLLINSCNSLLFHFSSLKWPQMQ
jgi:hypothetical protein